MEVAVVAHSDPWALQAQALDEATHQELSEEKNNESVKKVVKERKRNIYRSALPVDDAAR